MKSNDRGFTLIELLTVVAIIGILAAIAIPQFSYYKKKGFDSRAELWLRIVATAEEAYFTDHTAYKACSELNCHQVLPGVDPVEPGVTLTITAVTPDQFQGTSKHANGTGRIFSWN